jgi:site-specific DNA-cytosine methylase
MNKPLNVLVACEFSGVVTAAFRKLGHNAYSCDILPTEGDPNYHIQRSIEEVDMKDFDLLIAFPPCTHLAVSGARYFAQKRVEQQQALGFVARLMGAPVPMMALENPIGVISRYIRKPDQIIQPWQFGHGETKATCLWLRGLSKLVPTNIVEGRKPKVHYESPGPNRWKNRSRTYQGIADAMAMQWGGVVDNQLR